IEVFNSEIKLLQSAFNEMKAIYKPKLENKNQTNSSDFLPLKDFFVIMKRANKTDAEIKNIIFKAIKNGDKRFIYNKAEKKLLILNEDFSDLI
ncbi:DNA-binding protein, partial [Aliarcobacter butzleri]